MRRHFHYKFFPSCEYIGLHKLSQAELTYTFPDYYHKTIHLGHQHWFDALLM